MFHLRRSALLFCCSAPAMTMHAQLPVTTCLDVVASGTQSPDGIKATLLRMGFVARQVEGENAGRGHLRIGPYNTPEAEIIRKQLAAQEYTVTLVLIGCLGSAPDANERMRRLEDEANAKLLAATTPVAYGDTESQAPGQPARRQDQETEALIALQENTERAKVDADNRRQAQAITDQQAEVERQQRESAPASAPPQQSTAATILNGISGAIAQATATQSQDSIIEALRQQQARMVTRQQQIAANQAVEQRRRAAGAVAPQQAQQEQQAKQAAPTLYAQQPQRAVSRASSATTGAHSDPESAVGAGLSFSTQDTNGNVSLGSGSPRACAVSNSGSQLPLVPGTTASTCNPASCRSLGYFMHVESRWTDDKTMVVGFFSNNSMSDATCTWAFHKHGVWTDRGEMVVKSGEKNKGGKFGGVWAGGTDSSTIQYACFEGIDPVDEHGKLCNADIVFRGMTNAGTDK